MKKQLLMASLCSDSKWIDIFRESRTEYVMIASKQLNHMGYMGVDGFVTIEKKYVDIEHIRIIKEA